LRAEQTAVIWQNQHNTTPLDWDDFAIRAIVLGLAPQLYHRLSQWDIHLPPRAKAKLAVTYQAQAKRSQAIYTQLDELLIACATANLHPVALKGVHLAAHYYAEPALRPMNDIDLLFTAEELPQAENLLAELGYGGKHKSADFGPGVTKHTSTFLRETEPIPSVTPNPYLSSHSQRMIEPHSSLEESWFGLKVDITSGIRQRTITAQLGQHDCLVLAHEDCLLHICVHFCFHLIMGAPSMVQFTDLLAVTQAHSTDWQLFSQRTRDYGAAPYALAALTLAQKLLDAPIPNNVLDDLAQATPLPLRQRITQLGLADILQRSQQKPLTTLKQRLLRGLQDRAETARWATDWRGRWQVWQTALHIGRTDTGQMLLRRFPQNN
jgi:hypothetical protein